MDILIYTGIFDLQCVFITMIISHLKLTNPETEEWSIQSNDEHSQGVAGLASRFAAEFGFASWGQVLGLLHDKGKEQHAFQRYIRGVSGYEPEYSAATKRYHAYVGALIAKKLYMKEHLPLSYSIMGHHGGLLDYGDFEDNMKQDIPAEVQLETLNIDLTVPRNFRLQKEDFHHWFRMLYSCLVDADYLDTEAFMKEDSARLRKHTCTLEELLPRLEIYLDTLGKAAACTPTNRIRAEIQAECLKASEYEPGFFSLTVPTGGGKTLSSLVWAMQHAIKYGKKRIIIAIPYTSIIIQTANTLRRIFGEENVLEHHSASDPDGVSDKQLALTLKLATENWDYPIVVTTNVQLFESLFSNRPSACRKLHNLCNSVLILDEVQTLPLEFLQPIVDSLKTFQRLFGTSILFTTASLPALKGEIRYGNPRSPKAVLRGIPDMREIIPESFRLHERLRRVDLYFDADRSSYSELAERISRHNRVLCVVNTRRDAQEIFSRLPEEGLTLHLSRMMCSRHIAETIAKIKAALQDEQQAVVRVISTQLIEAGVDIDFPVVFRQEAGLDSVLQAAGRCNREGKKERGSAYVFRLERSLPPGYLSRSSEAQKNLPKDSDWLNPETMIRYFIQLYSRTDTFDKANIATHLYKPCDFAFKTAAKEFKLINDNCQTIIVNYGDSMELVQELRERGPSYGLIKRLNQYSVNMREKDFEQLKGSGLVEEIVEGMYVLPDREQYNEKVGLVTDNHWLEELLIK